MDIREFLLARAAEDEMVARAALEAKQAPSGPRESSGHWMVDWTGTRFPEKATADHAALYDPIRALRECAAKRAIIGSPVPQELKAWSHGVDPSPHTLRALATVYADHPDYKPEWAQKGMK